MLTGRLHILPLKQNFNVQLLLVLTICLFVSACGTEQAKTASMLKREQAFKQAQQFVASGEALLDEIESGELSNQLDNLLLLQTQIRQAKHIYKRADIEAWDHPSLDALTNQVATFTPKAAKVLQDNLLTALALTQDLRTRIEDVKNRPYGAADSEVDSKVSRLSADYNQALARCCKTAIAASTKFLQKQGKAHRDLQKLGLNLDYYMEEVIRSEQNAASLKQQILAGVD